jgi:hypothetical protein
MVGEHVPLTFVCLLQLYFISSRDLSTSLARSGAGQPGQWRRCAPAAAVPPPPAIDREVRDADGFGR